MTILLFGLLSGPLVFVSGNISAQEVQKEAASAEEIQKEDISEEAVEETGSEEAYEFPEIKPKWSAFTGFRFVDANGSLQAIEYEYPHSSILLGGELSVFSFPHRLHLDADIKNRKDYSGEADYAFKDIVFFRGINRTLFHNLENIGLIDLDSTTPSPRIDVRDADRKYGIKDSISNLFLRLKTPDFPAHFYIDGGLSGKNGTQQQRSLSGSGMFNDIVRTSRQRSIDWQAKTVAVGTNSHLGPVEIDISHGEKRFDVSGDKVLYDNYSATTYAPFRSAGIYPHNLIPELKESTNTLKIHTVYTGGLVASATISMTDKNNRDSGAKAGYLIGSGEVMWMPITKLTFFLKYRHKEIDSDTPGSVALTDISNPLNSYTYQVRPSVSSKTDTVSWSVRYRPFSGLTLRGEYSYEDIERKDVVQWGLPESTQRHIILLSADARPLKSLSLKTNYTHKEINNPAYNTDPDQSDEGKISVSWIPLQKINALLSYSLSRERRDSLYFTDSSGNIVSGASDRAVYKDKIFGNVAILLLRDLSLTPSYTDMRNRTKQDIVYSPQSGINKIDTLIPYSDKARTYAIDANYTPKYNVSITAGVSRTMSSGNFSPGAADLREPVSIASFSEIKIKETLYSLSGEYRFKGDTSVGVNYKYNDFKDVLDNPHNDVNNGTAHILMFTLSKRW